MSFAANFRGWVRQDGLLPALRYVRHLISERSHERRYGIATKERVDLGQHGYDSRYVGHHPTPYKALKTIFRDLPYEHGDQEVLVDFGSGAGRSTLVACMVHPFKAAHGVELVPELVKLAQENRQQIKVKLACEDIRFVQSNAVDYALPDDATVCFLFNPFKGDLLQKVLQNIQASIGASPRAVLIVYVNPTMEDPPCWMERIRVISTYPFVCHVYRAEPARA